MSVLLLIITIFGVICATFNVKSANANLESFDKTVIAKSEINTKNVNKVNMTASSLMLIEDVPYSKELLMDQENKFQFRCDLTSDYHFKITYAAAETTFDIKIVDEELQNISFNQIQIPTYCDILNKTEAQKLLKVEQMAMVALVVKVAQAEQPDMEYLPNIKMEA